MCHAPLARPCNSWAATRKLICKNNILCIIQTHCRYNKHGNDNRKLCAGKVSYHCRSEPVQVQSTDIRSPKSPHHSNADYVLFLLVRLNTVDGLSQNGNSICLVRTYAYRYICVNPATHPVLMYERCSLLITQQVVKANNVVRSNTSKPRPPYL
jgi:hypothetical protein